MCFILQSVDLDRDHARLSRYFRMDGGHSHLAAHTQPDSWGGILARQPRQRAKARPADLREMNSNSMNAGLLRFGMKIHVES
jgi:hypothetical protein